LGRERLRESPNDIILRRKEVPEAWRMIRVMLMHKKCDKGDLRNYRPISIISTMSKLLAMILRDRLERIIEESNFLGDFQAGFRPDRGADDNLFILGRMMEIAKHEKRCIFLAFIDFEKAYDSVSREKLWEVLADYGLEEGDIDLIRTLYTGMKVSFVWNGIRSKVLQATKGVKQGCPMSPLQFNIYMHGIDSKIVESGIGFKIGSLSIGTLLYADDVLLCAETEHDLKKLLEILQDVVSEYGLNINHKKSGIVRIGQAVQEGKAWNCGGGDICEKGEYTYLGIKVIGGLKAQLDDFKERMQRVGKTFGLIKYGGARAAAREWMMREAWKGICVPILMYGGAVNVWRQQDLCEMEKMQNEMGRLILQTKKWVPVPWIRGECGWSTFEQREAKAKLKYLVKLVHLDEKDPRRLVLEYVVRNKCGSSWVRRVRFLARKWDLEEWSELCGAGDLGYWGMRAAGVGSGGRLWWSREVERRVDGEGLRMWRNQMRDGGVLDRAGYRDYKREPRWEIGVRGVGGVVLAKIRGGVLEVADNPFMRHFEANTKCPVCKIDDETVRHWLWDCLGREYVEVRSRYVEKGLIAGNQIQLLESGGCGDRVALDFLEDMWLTRLRVRLVRGTCDPMAV
jgi:hypothetical protein